MKIRSTDLSSANSAIDTATTDPSSLLHDACGVLTVQAYSRFMQPSPREEAQFHDALRAIDGTVTGAALLRAIQACAVPAGKHPVCIFYERDPLDSEDPEFEPVRFEDTPTIHFNVLPPDAQADKEKHTYRLMTLFAELVSLYACNLGEPCVDPTAGFRSFRMTAFRKEIGHPAPEWLVDMDDYVLERAKHGEDRRAIKDLTAKWIHGRDPEAELDLSYHDLDLASFPPLRNVPGLSRLNLFGNRLAGFPAMDSLPLTLRDISLAGNPIKTGADRYGPCLRLVVLSLAADAVEDFRALLPEGVEIVRSDARLVELLGAVEGLRYGVVSPRELVEAGYTDEKTAELIGPELFVTAVEPWLQPYPLDRQVWIKAHEHRANLAVGMTAMLDRLTRMPAAEDAAFRQKFADLLNKMQLPGHQEFFDLCLEIAGSGAESCDDRILETLNELFIAWQCVDGNTGAWDMGADLMQHARQAFALAAAKQFIARLMPELEERFRRTRPEETAPPWEDPANENEREELDQLEQFLMLRTRIAQKDPGLLPPMQFEMKFGAHSILDDNDIEQALHHIEKARDADWITFLGEWKPLKAIDAMAPELVKHEKQQLARILGDRGVLYRALDRLLNTKGDLFVHAGGSGTMLFDVKYPAFWTHYELMIVRKLAESRPECSASNIARRTAGELAKRMVHAKIARRTKKIIDTTAAREARAIALETGASLVMAVADDGATESREIIGASTSKLKGLMPGQAAEALITDIADTVAAKADKALYGKMLAKVKRKVVDATIAQVKAEIVSAKRRKGNHDAADAAATNLDYEIGRHAPAALNEARSVLRHRTVQEFLRMQGRSREPGRDDAGRDTAR